MFSLCRQRDLFSEGEEHTIDACASDGLMPLTIFFLIDLFFSHIKLNLFETDTHNQLFLHFVLQYL